MGQWREYVMFRLTIRSRGVFQPQGCGQLLGIPPWTELEIAASSAGHVNAAAFGLAAPATPTLRKAGAYQMAGSPCWLQPEQYLLSSHRKACVSQLELPRRDRRHK